MNSENIEVISHVENDGKIPLWHDHYTIRKKVCQVHFWKTRADFARLRRLCIAFYKIFTKKERSRFPSGFGFSVIYLNGPSRPERCFR